MNREDCLGGDKVKYNRGIALKMQEEYNQGKGLYKKMYDYYIGNTEVKKENPKTDRSNRIVMDNFVKSFSDEEVSFMVGLPITYVNLFNNDNSTIEDINIKMNLKLNHLIH